MNMYLKLSSFFYLICSLSAVLAAENAGNKTIVSIYYETYCPKSIEFISQQFAPPFLSELNKFIVADLVPYGNATTIKGPNGTLIFNCEHGEKECEANKIHACVLSLPTQIASPLNKIKFVNCSLTMIKLDPATDPTKNCATSSGVNYESIMNCKNNKTEADTTLEAYGKRTREFNDYGNVPFVALNYVLNLEESKKLVSNFADTYCSLVTFNDTKPDVCKSKGNSATSINPVFGLPVLMLSSILFVKFY